MSYGGLTLIAKASNTGSIFIDNIPQTYTHLIAYASTKSNFSGPSLYLMPNNLGTSIASFTTFRGDGTNVSTERLSNSTFIRFTGAGNGTESQTNIYGSVKYIIMNYRTSNFKNIMWESTSGRNSGVNGGVSMFGSAIYRNTSPVTNLDFGTDGTGGFFANTTVYLYGCM